MGRRWGKTFMAGSYALTCADYGAAVAWVAPTYKNARALWRFAEAQVAQALGRVKVNRSEFEITFPSGGRLDIYSADNDVALRGEAFDLVIVDEAARVREETYTDVLVPTLADRGGRCLLISTPAGRNWFWREWLRGREGGSDIVSYQAPSAANPNPRIKRAAELAREQLPEQTYRQEWLAEFIEHGGQVFRNIAACLHAPPTMPADHKGHTFAFGVDWGKQADYTAISVVCKECKREVARDRFNQIDYALQRGRLRALWERWRTTRVLAESNAMGEPIIEQLVREGIRVRGFATTATSKPPLIESLALCFERAECQWQADPIWTGELEAYERKVSATTGRPSYSAPEGCHDDTVMARALAWQGIVAWGVGFG